MTVIDLGNLPEDTRVADGFDEAVIGVAYRFGFQPVIAYDYERCVEILMSGDDGMTYEDAIDYMEYNVLGAYMGDGMPCFIQPGELPPIEEANNE
tara:strand:+ start:655 stop:939 length:285 start_codon:yes stop_codon:yes gene_type:complete